MKAAVFYKKEDLRVEELPIPVIKKDEVLVRVRACGVCGTDVHIFSGDEGAAPTPAGTVLGHEFAGEIVEVGADVTGYAVGDIVSVDPNKLCGECSFCRGGLGHFCTAMRGIGTTENGGFAEYCAAPVSQLCKYPAGTPFEAAAMTEPVSCCLHGIDLCGIKPGATVAVIGCGMIGLLMLQLAKLSGAGTLIAVEPIADKRAKAQDLGADYVLDPMNCDIPAAVAAITPQVDVVIECVGKTATMQQAVDIAGCYSTVMLFGLTSPDAKMELKPFQLFKKEITVKASFINPYTFERAKALIGSGKIDVTSMIYARPSVEELPGILADKQARVAGKYVVML